MTSYVTTWVSWPQGHRQALDGRSGPALNGFYASNGENYFDTTPVTAPPPIGRLQRRAVTCAGALRLSVGWSGLLVFTARLDGCWWYWEKCNVVPSVVGINTAAGLKVSFWTFHRQTLIFVTENCCHPSVLTVKCVLAGLADASLALACSQYEPTVICLAQQITANPFT